MKTTRRVMPYTGMLVNGRTPTSEGSTAER
jgi:hypothetical protein